MEMILSQNFLSRLNQATLKHRRKSCKTSRRIRLTKLFFYVYFLGTKNHTIKRFFESLRLLKFSIYI